MLTSLLLWFAALWISCAPTNPTPAQGASALEQMEAEIARIVEQVRPSIVGVSVTRKHGGAMGHGQSWGGFPGQYYLRVAPTELPAAEEPSEPYETPEPEGMDEEMEELQEEAERLRERVEEQSAHAREHARKLRKEAELLRESAEEGMAPLLGRVASPGQLSLTANFYGKSIGSGFAIEGGYIVTTHTIAANGDEIVLSLPDGKEAKGKLVGSDDATDIALIKLEEGSAPALRFGDSGKCRVGSIGVFLSRSYGKLDNVNFGFVTGREDAGGEMLRLNFPIGPGESGSPLLNARGEVIGIASANLRKNLRTFTPTATSNSGFIYTTVEAPEAWGGEGSRELSYFIPSERVKTVIEDLKQYGEVRRAWFGVSGTDTTIKISASEKQRGVLIEEVIEDSSAQKAGVQVGDILLRCNGQATPNFTTLRAIIEKLPVGKPVKVTVRRSGKEVELDVTPQARPNAGKMTKAGSIDLGMNLVPKSKELASYLNLADSPDGKVVASVAKDSLAERAGIRKGDLLLDDPKPGKPLRVWRDGTTLEIVIPTASSGR